MVELQSMGNFPNDFGSFAPTEKILIRKLKIIEIQKVAIFLNMCKLIALMFLIAKREWV